MMSGTSFRGMKRLGSTAFIAVLLSNSIGCKPAPKAFIPQPGTVEFKIAQIGNAAVAASYPKYDRKKYPVLINRHNDTWVFEYQLPDNMIGGTPVVIVDKNTLKVIKTYESQ
jgi:hypothetical protein